RGQAEGPRGRPRMDAPSTTLASSNERSDQKRLHLPAPTGMADSCLRVGLPAARNGWVAEMRLEAPARHGDHSRTGTPGSAEDPSPLLLKQNISAAGRPTSGRPKTRRVAYRCAARVVADNTEAESTGKAESAPSIVVGTERHQPRTHKPRPRRQRRRRRLM